MRQIYDKNLAQLLLQLKYTPEKKRRKQLEAAENLCSIIQKDKEYPFDFIYYQITGFQPQAHTTPPDPMVRLIDGVHEVLGVGTIFNNEKGIPKMHMHASFGRGEKSITGCIRLGIDIWEIGEIVLLEISNTFAHRTINGKTSFELLEIEKREIE